MKSPINNVLGTSEAQELYWSSSIAMSRKMICESINSGRLLGRKTKPNGGYIIDKRSVELDIAYIKQIKAEKFENNKQLNYFETLHLNDMKKYNAALSKGDEDVDDLIVRDTPCEWCGSLLAHDVECC